MFKIIYRIYSDIDIEKVKFIGVCKKEINKNTGWKAIEFKHYILSLIALLILYFFNRLDTYTNALTIQHILAEGLGFLYIYFIFLMVVATIRKIRRGKCIEEIIDWNKLERYLIMSLHTNISNSFDKSISIETLIEIVESNINLRKEDFKIFFSYPSSIIAGGIGVIMIRNFENQFISFYSIALLYFIYGYMYVILGYVLRERWIYRCENINFMLKVIQYYSFDENDNIDTIQNNEIDRITEILKEKDSFYKKNNKEEEV